MKDILAIGVGAVGATIFWMGASCRPTSPAQGEIPTIHITPPPVVPPPVALTPTPAPEPSGPTLLEVPPGALDPLYAALALAEARDPAGRADLLFFGDSHTAGDLMTGYLRRELQARFGDAGRGYVLAGHPPIKYYTQRDIQCASTGRWTAELGGKRHASEPFGMAGVRVHSEDKNAIAWVETCAGCKTGGEVDRFDVYYLRTKASGTLGYKVDDGDWNKLATKLVPPVVASATDVPVASTPAGDAVPATFTIPVSLGRHKISLRPQGGGPVELFGVALERNQPGVIVDSLGVVGRRLAHLFHWDWAVIGPQLAQRDPALVVIQYGTNEADDPDLELDTLARQYDAVIARVREHAPRAAILLLGPPDMAVRAAGKACDHRPPPPPNPDGTPGVDPDCAWRTPAILPQIIEVEREAARRNRVAFFDTFTALGGADRMDEFFHQEPSLAYGDHVHFTDKGYQRWGQALLEQLLAGYDQWKQRAPQAR